MSAVASLHKHELSPLYLDQETAASGKAHPDSKDHHHQQPHHYLITPTAYSPARTRISLPPIRPADQRQRQAADGGQDKDKDSDDSNHLAHRSTHLPQPQRTTSTHADDRQILPGIDRLTPQGPLEARPSSPGSGRAGQQAAAARTTAGWRPASSSSSSAFDPAMSAAAAPKTEHAHQLLPPPPGYHDSQVSHSALALHSYSHAHNRHRAHSQTSAPNLGESLPPPPWDPAKAGRPSTSTPSLTRPRSPSPLRRSNGPSSANNDVNGGEGCKKRKYAGMASLSAAAAAGGGGGASDRTADVNSPDIPTASHHHHHSFPGVSSLDQYTPTLEPSTSTNFSFDTSQVSPYNQSIDELSTTAGGTGGAGGAASASQRSHSAHSPSPEGDEKGGNGRTLKQTKRAAQNRAAQQAFRKRKEERMKELEEKEKLLNSLVAREAEVEKRERALAAKLHAHATAGPVASSTASVSAHTGSPSSSAAIAGPSNTSHDWERAFTGFRGPIPSVAAAPPAPSNQQYQSMCEKYEVATREKMELRRALEDTNIRLADREQLVDSLRRSLEDMASENRSLRAAAEGALGRGR